jgi:hypothetical protein
MKKLATAAMSIKPTLGYLSTIMKGAVLRWAAPFFYVTLPEGGRSRIEREQAAAKAVASSVVPKTRSWVQVGRQDRDWTRNLESPHPTDFKYLAAYPKIDAECMVGYKTGSQSLQPHSSLCVPKDPEIASLGHKLLHKNLYLYVYEPYTRGTKNAFEGSCKRIPGGPWVHEMYPALRACVQNTKSIPITT